MLELFSSQTGLKAVVYCRVSSKMQLDGSSLTIQYESCTRFIKSKNWTLIKTYTDEAISGARADRPAFQQMLKDAEAGYFDVIVVYALDRFSRSLTLLMLTMRDMQNCGILIASATEPFDFSTITGKLMMAILGALAEWFLGQLGLRVSGGLYERAKAGHYIGRLAFGYSAYYKKDGGDGLAFPDDNALGVKLAFEEYATGLYSDNDIANLLNNFGYRPTGRNGNHANEFWTKDTIRELLQLRFYYGIVTCRGEEFEGVHEPVITKALFDECQEVRKKRGKEAKGRKRADRVYLCSGLCYCARCGSKMRISTRGRGKYPAYYCRKRADTKGKDCDASQVKMWQVDARIEAIMRNLVLPETWWQEVINAVDEEVARDNVALDREALESRLKKLDELYEWDRIDRDEYLAKTREVQETLDSFPGDESFDLVSIPNNFSEIWNEATDKEKHSLVEVFINKIKLDHHYKDGLVGIEFNYDFVTTS